MEQENKPSYNILQPLLLSACMAIGMMVGYKINEKPENTLVSTLDFPADSMMMTGRVEELIRFVENKYVEKVDGNILIDEALTAVFSKLDPHSIYLSPHEVGDVNDQMDGSYNGIGIENFFVDDTVFVSSVLDNSPAKKSARFRILPGKTSDAHHRHAQAVHQNHAHLQQDFQSIRDQTRFAIRKALGTVTALQQKTLALLGSSRQSAS